MNSITRVIGSLIVAAAFGVPLMVMVMRMSGLNFFEAILAFFMCVFMFSSFGVIWNWGNVEGSQQEESSAKSKRKEGDRINRLLSKLDEDDLEVLRERLLEDEARGYALSTDGELIQRR